MVWLPDGEKSLKICLFVLTCQRDRHTDTQTDTRTHTQTDTQTYTQTHKQTHRQTPHDDIGRACASHRAAKIVIFDQYLALSPK